MWRSKTSRSPKVPRAFAVVIGLLFAFCFAAPSALYLRQQSGACEANSTQDPNSDRHGVAFNYDHGAGYQLQYNPSTEEEPVHCVWGHAADEWIAGLTGMLVAFTAGLAAFTALLWWTTYDLWRSAEDGERIRERAYLRISLTGNTVLRSLNLAESKLMAQAQPSAAPSIDFGFSGDGGELRRALTALSPWDPPSISFRVTNHGKTPADLLWGKAIFSHLAAHDPPRISNDALEAITFNRSSLAPTESTEPETRFPDTIFEEADAIRLKNDTGGVLFFDCIVAYKDIWEDTHTELFRAVWNPRRVAFDITRWEQEIRSLQEAPLRKKLRRNARTARRWRLLLRIWSPVSRWLERKAKERAERPEAD